MSHVSLIELEIKDLDCLKEACEELGLTFQENKKNYRWFGRWMNDYHEADAAYLHGIDPNDYGKCDHCITAADWEFDIGLVKNKNNSGYQLIYDNWGIRGKKIEEVVGKGCQILANKYAEKVIIKNVNKNIKNKGFKLHTRQQLNDGTVKLVFKRK